MAVLYSLFGALTVFGTGNATQVNTIVTAIDTALTQYNVIGADHIPTVNLVIGILCAMLVAMVLLGGIKRIGSVSEKLVPFMALLYVLLGLGVVVLNITRLPEVLASIVVGAFNPKAFTGGAIGSLFISMQRGVSRGIFSNEAGLGTGSIAHACADTKKPVKQGVCRYHRHLHIDGACHFVQRHGGELRHHGGRRPDDFRLYDDLRQLGFHFLCGRAVLLRVLDHHRLGPLRLAFCGISVPHQ